MQEFLSLGDYPQALKLFKQALVIRREVKDSVGEGGTLNLLGLYYRNQGEYSQALEYYQQSLVIVRKLGNKAGEASILNNLGDIYRNLGNYPEALKLFEQTLTIFKQVGSRFGEGTTLGNIGRVYVSWGKYPQSLEYFEQALTVLRQIGDRAGEARNLKNMGYALYQSGKFVEAEKTLCTAIEVLESLRTKLTDANKVSIFETQADAYRFLQEVLIAQNKTSLALEISERGRARAFVELLTSRLSNKTTSQTSDSPVNKPTLSLLQQIAKQQNATLVEYSMITENFNTQGKQKSQESEIYIWVIKPTGEVTFRKSDLKPLWQKENTTLEKLVTSSRKSIGVIDARGRDAINVVATVDQPSQTQRLQQLHKLLIEPIADLLPNKETERVVFIPQSSLFLVPFPALQDANGKYLIEKHTILTAPSIQVLDLTHKRRLETQNSVSTENALIVGNPTMPKVILEPGKPAQQLKALPWAEKEAKDIASLLKTQAFTGNQATKTAIAQKMLSAKIIHLATHGILDDIQGLGSAIALAPSGKDDGLLTADEIFNLKLSADLVVLSACNTGRGKITGDGVIGLSRSLISAGVPSIMVSLWSVDDNSTSFLMTKFYQNMQQKLDKATALRNAMLTTKKKYPNPLYWSAFTLIGESE